MHNTGLPLTLKRLRNRGSTSGWGLDIVDALAAWWSIESGPLGTTVTVVLTAVDEGFEEG